MPRLSVAQSCMGQPRAAENTAANGQLLPTRHNLACGKAVRVVTNCTAQLGHQPPSVRRQQRRSFKRVVGGRGGGGTIKPK